jgi:type VI secretion system protein VasG
LLDEVEKADPEVLNLFYQVFDKGMLADGEGRIIDFKNTIICMTSNLASDVITQMCTNGNRPELETLGAAIRPILSAHFKPALLARMTIVPFYPISPDVMKSIVQLKLNQLGTRLKTSQRMDFRYEEKVVEQIAARCTEVETGARNIDHILNGTLLPQIATAILQRLGEESMPHTLELGIDQEGQFVYRFLDDGGVKAKS